MGSKCNTSSLFSTYASSKLRRNYSRNTGSTTRYVVGSVGRSCGKHRHNDDTSNCRSGGSHISENKRVFNKGDHRNQNVAIATQVLNPSAIGGSLKNRRFVEHFGRKDDDEISFLSHRQRSVWGKFCCYSVAISVTVLMITGMIVAVGYMQSEKQRISTRPVKLAQGQSFDSFLSTTHIPSSVLKGTTTTEKPTENDDTDDMDEIGIDDYLQAEADGSHLQKLDHFHEDSEENNISDEYPSRKFPPFRSSFNRNSGQLTRHEEEEDATSEDRDSETNAHGVEDVDDNNDSFKEVRVLPPPNFSFEGISFGIPIYHSNHSAKASNQNASETVSNDQDAYDEESDRNTKNPKHSLEEEETKEIESTIKPSSNFTSLIDSEEEEANKRKSKYEEIPLNHHDENYANALSDETDDLIDSHTIKTKTNISKDFVHNNTFESLENDSSTTVNDKDKSNIDIKAGGGYGFATTTEAEAETQDFDTAPVALQTDIFDNEDFETSASEENGFDARRNGNGGGGSRERYRGQHDDNIRQRPLGQRQQNKKGLSRSKAPSDNHHDEYDDRRQHHRPRPRPPPDYVDDDNFRSDHKKLSLRPLTKNVRMKGNNNRNNFNDDFHNDNRGGNNRGDDKEKVVDLKQTLLELKPQSGNSHSTSITMPILEYKTDFSKFIPTPSPSPSPSPPPESSDPAENFQYEIQPLSPPANHVQNPYPDFKFTPVSSEEGDKPFNLKEYLDKHANKGDLTPVSTSSGSSGTSGNANTDRLVEQFSIHSPPTDFSITANAAGFQIPSASSLTAVAGGGGGGNSLDLSGFPNQLSKRTFYNFDYTPSSPSTNSNGNAFAHLLGPNKPTTNFGTASAAGATYNLFQPTAQPNYNFATSSTNPGGFSYDFSSSSGYNGPASPAVTSKHGFTVDANGAFSLTNPNPSSLPYPNISPSDNLGGGSNNYQNTFSFSNPGSSGSNSGSFNSGGSYGSNSGGSFGSNNGVGILTTGTGQVPTYNTITQGIHLLSLLSGKTPDGLQGGNDQLQSGSSNNYDFARPELQTSGYGGSNSNTRFLQGLETQRWKFPVDSENSASVAIPQYQYSQDFFPRKNFRSFDGLEDQDSSASSFSKNIVLKASELENSKSLKALQTGKKKAEGTTTESSFRLLLSSKNANPITISAGNDKPNSPKSGRRISSRIPIKRPSSSGSSSSELDFESLPRKSRKRLMHQDMEVAESNLDSVTTRNSPVIKKDSARMLRHFAKTPQKKDGGLKSGFFT